MPAKMPPLRKGAGLPEYLISDTHFGHDRIVAYQGRPADHDQVMIEHWRKLPARAHVLHLGDISMRRLDPALATQIAKLPGRLEYIKGDHDRPAILADILPRWHLVEPYSVGFEGWCIAFTHEPLKTPMAARVISVHGHAHSMPEESIWAINVCVEQTDYAPVLAKPLIETRIRRLVHDRNGLELELEARWDNYFLSLPRRGQLDQAVEHHLHNPVWGRYFSRAVRRHKELQ